VRIISTNVGIVVGNGIGQTLVATIDVDPQDLPQLGLERLAVREQIVRPPPSPWDIQITIRPKVKRAAVVVRERL
jgi:hypothetical protein